LGTFEVLQPGLLTTVQDMGRYGYQQYGVSVAGAMDTYSLRIANLLVGNQENEACLEITLMGLRLAVLADSVISVTGGDLNARLDSESLPLWQAVHVKHGQVISFLSAKKGCRSYLAVSGGLEVPQVMGSRATCLKSHDGGYKGRALEKGDLLGVGPSNKTELVISLPPEYIPAYSSEVTVRTTYGPQINSFTEKGVSSFYNSEYSVSPDSNRVAYRLKGPAIEYRGTTDIISEGIPPGAIQVPGDGLPIILLAERPTTGGYAKLATVISADIPFLAQTRPGDKVRFQQVTLAEAHRALVLQDQSISGLRKMAR
jgi:antagonist of KipI